jgi:hypothetical protein
MRKTAEHRLVQLDILDEIDRLNEALARAGAASGVRATSWDALARRGWLRRVPPTDPSGMPYVIDPTTGLATVDPRSTYYPLPTDPPLHEAGTAPAQGAR